jgi:hypothetical protein
MNLDYRDGGKPQHPSLIGLAKERLKLWKLCRKHNVEIPHVTVAPGATEEEVLQMLQRVLRNGVPQGKEIKLEEIF